MILLISGWKGSGKDTVAGHLVKNHGFTQLSFAHPLKDLTAELYGLPRDWMDRNDKKEEPLLNLPVSPKDAFSRNVAEFMFGEFRTSQGERPHGFDYQGSDFYVKVYSKEDGLYSKKGDETLVRAYWTPRALLILEGSMKRSVDSNYWVSQALSKTEPGKDYVISDLRYKSEVEAVKGIAGSDAVTLRVERFAESTSTDPSERDLDNYEFDIVLENDGTLQDLYHGADSALVHAFMKEGRKSA